MAVWRGLVTRRAQHDAYVVTMRAIVLRVAILRIEQNLKIAFKYARCFNIPSMLYIIHGFYFVITKQANSQKGDI